MMNTETLQYFVEGQVAMVYLNRPPFNPLNKQLFSDLHAIMEQIAQDNRIRCVIISGRGDRAFAAGADIHEMNGLDQAGMAEMGRMSRKAFDSIERLPKPVIAAVNGLALGGGCELALACDLRICSENAKFALPEINLGIIPGGGGTQRLPRLIGEARAKELLYFGETIGAEQAYDYGLVHKVVPFEELVPGAKKWALKLAEKPAVAMSMLKICVNAGANRDLDSALDLEFACFGNAFASEDRKEGMAAFAEKRKPHFMGR